MGNFGSRKKEKEQEVADDVWMKLNDGQQKSPKSKKKKKKKRKKKDKDDSPDKEDCGASQCDSYSYSTLSSRRLSDSTIASAGTITHQDNEHQNKMAPNQGFNYTDDQSNGSIGYVTASDTFTTPPSPRKGHKAKFSPIIARDSPRVVRRLLQSEKILETKEEQTDNLSPRAKFFLSTPEPPGRNTGFDNRKFSRRSSGSSVESNVQQRSPINQPKHDFLIQNINENRKDQETKQQSNDNRCITNGSLLVKSRNHEPRTSNTSRISNNSLEMSDSTQENLMRTGEKAKWLRYDDSNLSPAQRRKFKPPQDVNTNESQPLPFIKTYNKPTTSNDNEMLTLLTHKSNKHLQDETSESMLRVESCVEHVPPPSPASGFTLSEVEEDDINLEHVPNKNDSFADSFCKRLSLLLESEHDANALERSEFHEFTDSHCSSPDIVGDKDIVIDEVHFANDACLTMRHKETNVNNRQANHSYSNERRSEMKTEVKTPQGKENASVLDVMNNNFRSKCEDAILAQHTNQMLNYRKVKDDQENKDIEKQMMNDNEINERLIEEQIKSLRNILPAQSDASKRQSTLFAVNNKHACDPDNYILVTKKTYCVKRGVLIELVDEEKDLITNEAIKTLDDGNDWIKTGTKEIYKPEAMYVEKGASISCPNFSNYKDSCYSGSNDSSSISSSSEPDYANLEDFERLEREFILEEQDLSTEIIGTEIIEPPPEFEDILTSDGEIDYENVLNRSQSQSDSEFSDSKHKRESEILCDVIKSYKGEQYLDSSDEVSEEEIVYANEPACDRVINVVRTPSKLDQSLKKIFEKKAKELAEREKEAQANAGVLPESPSLINIKRSEASGYDSPYHKSSDSSRRSLAYTESDLDASEKWDDDDDASNDSMLADDEYDEDDYGQVIFSKPYKEYDQKADAMFSFNMVQTLPESPIVFEPEADDDDVFHDDIPVASSGYCPEDSFELESSDEAFDDARKQMIEIHEQLQSLKNQMGSFENEENSSIPTSPLHTQYKHYKESGSE